MGMNNMTFAYLLVLVGRHSDKLGLGKRVARDHPPRTSDAHYVETGFVLV